MATIDFKDREDVERWLKSRPHEDAIVLAARAALRVVPLLRWPGKDFTKLSEEAWRTDVLLPCLRALALSWLAARYSHEAVERRTAYVAARAGAAAAVTEIDTAIATDTAITVDTAITTDGASTARAAVFSAVYSAFVAAHSGGRAASFTSRVASSAAHATVDSPSIWKAVTLDARALAGVDGVVQLSSVTLAHAPLWPEGVPHWARDAIILFEDYLLALQRNHPDEHWHVWLSWCLVRYNGGNVFGLNDAAAERVETGIVLLPDEVWKAGPKAVNTAIHDLIQKERAGKSADAAAGNVDPATNSVDTDASAPAPGPSRAQPEGAGSPLWTEERLERLKQLWSDGFSAQQIAHELGGVTRNGVIGKVHRLGLSGRAKKLTSDLRPRPATRKRESLQKLADLASPQPVLTDGKLDAEPNRVFDRPVVDDDLATLPTRQRALIEGVILTSLSVQTPRQLRNALQAYADELAVRGTQPILGLLADMRAIISADLHAAGARAEWLEEGMVAAFERFESNDKLLEAHFPLDAEREEIYAATPVDEEAAMGSALRKPFEDLKEATHAAHEAGLTTDNFVKVVDGMAESAKVIATLPPESMGPKDTLPVLQPDDRPVPRVSAKKRKVLSGVGFAERNINLMSATATMVYSPPAQALLDAFRKALEQLLKFLPNAS